MRLAKGLDYETRASFVLQIVAENAWTDTDYDTRNVAAHEFIVEVMDVPDTAPYFLSAPPVTTLPETAKEVRTNLLFLFKKCIKMAPKSNTKRNVYCFEILKFKFGA